MNVLFEVVFARRYVSFLLGVWVFSLVREIEESGGWVVSRLFALSCSVCSFSGWFGSCSMGLIRKGVLLCFGVGRCLAFNWGGGMVARWFSSWCYKVLALLGGAACGSVLSLGKVVQGWLKVLGFWKMKAEGGGCYRWIILLCFCCLKKGMVAGVWSCFRCLELQVVVAVGRRLVFNGSRRDKAADWRRWEVLFVHTDEKWVELKVSRLAFWCIREESGVALEIVAFDVPLLE